MIDMLGGNSSKFQQIRNSFSNNKLTKKEDRKVKKVLINIFLVISFIIIYFLQINLFFWLKLHGVMQIYL